MLALAQGDRARAERIARTPPPGVDPTELAYHFARFEELGWLLDDAQQRRLLELDVAFYEGDRATGDWSTPSSTPCGDSRRSREPSPTRLGSPTKQPSERPLMTGSSMPC